MVFIIYNFQSILLRSITQEYFHDYFHLFLTEQDIFYQ